MTMDISNFYLNTPSPTRIHPSQHLRHTTRDHRGIQSRDIAEEADPFISMQIKVCRAPDGGLNANELLEKRLNKAGYYQSKLACGTHYSTHSIHFGRDDFGVKYIGTEHALHLKSVIEEHYKCSADWYHNRLGLANRKYGAKKQYALQESTATLLGKNDKKFIQQSTLHCYVPSAIASQSTNPTSDTMKQTKQLLDYIASQENAVITYNASDMVLATHSDAGYLNEPKARSRAGGHFFLSTSADIPPNNGAILNIAHIIKHVMSSATEAELAALYINARSHIHLNYPRGTRTHTTSYPTSNGQRNGRGSV
eukprot:CCRYP_007675-RA/>CCRYP_007675-RA protein AED:0.41 eAED:0.41 QI:0/0/0/1/0/0/5/0/309